MREYDEGNGVDVTNVILFFLPDNSDDNDELDGDSRV